MKNILILGGTGYLGQICEKYNTLYNILAVGSKQIDTNLFSSVDKILQYIVQHNISIIVDFTRNTKRQLNTFLMLINKLPKNCKYVHISTYGIMYNEYSDNSEYIFVKQTIEQKLRNNDLAIRLPLILDTPKNIIDDIKNKLEDQYFKIKYIHINFKEDFAKYFFSLLNNDLSAIQIMPSLYIKLQKNV